MTVHEKMRLSTKLLTESEVLAQLRDEISASTLTETAEKYGIKPSQISDVLYGRANLSARMLSRMRLRMHKFYERVAGSGGTAKG